MSIIAVYLIFSMLAVLWFDTTRYIIPNWLVASLVVLYPLGVYLAHGSVEWKPAVLGAVVMLAVGYIIFIKNWMGGGDIKLLIACSLWVGWENLVNFIFTVALLGGVLALGALCLRKLMPYIPRKTATPPPRILRDGEPVPYGVAVAFGFLLMMWMGKVPALGDEAAFSFSTILKPSVWTIW